MALIVRLLFGLAMVVAPIWFVISTVSDKIKSRNRRESDGNQMGNRRFGFENKHYEDNRHKYARERFERELKSVRDYERAKKRKFSRIDNAWRLVSVGAGLLTGGFLLDVNAPAAVGLGILVGGAVGWVGAIINNFLTRHEKSPEILMQVPKRAEYEPPKVQQNGAQAGKNEFASKVIEEGHENLKSLELAMVSLRHPQSINTVAKIIEIGRKLLAEIAENPEFANTAQRLFTYYAKEASKVVEGLGKIESEKRPDIERVIATQTILQKILVLFESTEIEMRQDENKLLDIDLKLLDQSLQADLRIK